MTDLNTSLDQAMADLVSSTRKMKPGPFVKKTAPLHVRSEDVLPVHDIPPVPANPPIQELPAIPHQVEQLLAIFKKRNEDSAVVCIRRAEELEAEAKSLRNRAAILNQQAVQIPEDFGHAVSYEIDCRNRAAALALVNPPKGGGDG